MIDGLLGKLSQLVRRHVVAQQDVTDPATKAAVRNQLAQHADLLNNLEHEVQILTDNVAAEQEAEALREWQSRQAR